MMLNLLHHIVLWPVSAALFTSLAAAQPTPVAACRVTAEPSRPLTLGDGRTMSIDVQSVAVSGGSVMAVGRNAYAFPRGASARTPPELRDSIFGVVIDGRGEVSTVPNPMLPRRAFFPRAVGAGDGGFHVLFVTSGDSAEHRMAGVDTGTIWYARFAAGRWTEPERVMSVHNVFLHGEAASDPILIDGSLSFFFPMIVLRGDEESGGVIHVRRAASGWHSDTLLTPSIPSQVRVVRDPSRRAVIALFVQRMPPSAEQVFFAHYDSAWRAPRLLGGDGRRTVTFPLLINAGDAVIASWVTWQARRQESSRIGWARIDADDGVVAGPVVDSGAGTFPFEVVALGNGQPVWLYHGEPFGDSVELATAVDSTIMPLGTLTIPFRSPKPKTVALSGTRLLVFTQKAAERADEPMATSYVTALEIRCPRSAQRE